MSLNEISANSLHFKQKERYHVPHKRKIQKLTNVKTQCSLFKVLDKYLKISFKIKKNKKTRCSKGRKKNKGDFNIDTLIKSS